MSKCNGQLVAWAAQDREEAVLSFSFLEAIVLSGLMVRAHSLLVIALLLQFTTLVCLKALGSVMSGEGG